MKTDIKNVREIEKLLRQYEDEVNKADYKDKTKETYTRYAAMFVRWCKDEFALRDFS